MLQVSNIQKAFDGKPVLKDINMTVANGEIVCLLGESGSGKTTLLRVITGLESADSGIVSLLGKPLDCVPVHKRGFGLMFQDFALFPHMTVAQNISYGLRMGGASKAEQANRTVEMLDLVDLSGFGNRAVDALSGGERQRVALARSLAPQPRLLLLDEPLGALDAALRVRLLADLRRIIKALGLTAIYVTHDQSEAFAVADRIAIMHAGEIQQIATPRQLYYAPQTRYIASFLGFRNFVAVQAYREDRAITALGDLTAPNERTDEILLHPAGLSIGDNGHMSGRIKSLVFTGSVDRVTVECDGGHTLVFDMPFSPNTHLDIGEPVRVALADWAVIGVKP
ncbi:MAG: ABC transporter ATP-binding protein [Chloroflexota bacterium]